MHIGAAVIVTSADFPGKILVVREALSDDGTGKQAGMVSIPAGHLDDAESFEVAAKREVSEESGWEVMVVGRLPKEYGDSRTRGFVFLAEAQYQDSTWIIPSDIAEVFWADIPGLLLGRYGTLRPQVIQPITDYFQFIRPGLE